MPKKIYLSPSNQKANTYATGNTNEMEQCDKICGYAKTALERQGFSVRVSASGATMATKVKESNEFDADLHIPVHTNAYNGAVTGGTLIMVYKTNGENKKAGQAILDAVNAITPGKGYTLRANTSLYEINQPKAKTVYLEVEFHDTKDGAEFIINNSELIGEAIAKGVCNYYGVIYKPSTSNDVTYRVQVGAFKSKQNAENLLQKLKQAGFTDSFIDTNE